MAEECPRSHCLTLESFRHCCCHRGWGVDASCPHRQTWRTRRRRTAPPFPLASPSYSCRRPTRMLLHEVGVGERVSRVAWTELSEALFTAKFSREDTRNGQTQLHSEDFSEHGPRGHTHTCTHAGYCTRKGYGSCHARLQRPRKRKNAGTVTVSRQIECDFGAGAALEFFAIVSEGRDRIATYPACLRATTLRTSTSASHRLQTPDTPRAGPSIPAWPSWCIPHLP